MRPRGADAGNRNRGGAPIVVPPPPPPPPIPSSSSEPSPRRAAFQPPTPPISRTARKKGQGGQGHRPAVVVRTPSRSPSPTSMDAGNNNNEGESGGGSSGGQSRRRKRPASPPPVSRVTSAPPAVPPRVRGGGDHDDENAHAAAAESEISSSEGRSGGTGAASSKAAMVPSGSEESGPDASPDRRRQRRPRTDGDDDDRDNEAMSDGDDDDDAAAGAVAPTVLEGASAKLPPPVAAGAGPPVDSASASASPPPRPPPDTSAAASSASATGAAAASSSSSIDDRTSRDYYFDSYSHHGIHEEMLKDEVRTTTYQRVILQNKHLFKDKIVLDVGCGTGVLSMFAAQAGAARVYGVDCSSIVDRAAEIVRINGFADTITLIKGKVEEVNLPVDEVDIIISEWMGYFLLYESMLDTVLYARDKWLKPGGLLLPDRAVMYLTAVEDGQTRHDKIDFWNNVYGFDMSPLREAALVEPVVDVVDAKSVCTDAAPVLSIDLKTCTVDDLSFSSSFKLTATRNDYVHAFVAYFECGFTQIHRPMGFSTSPFARYTHWKQTIFYVRDGPLTICRGEEVNGTISCRPNRKNRRDLDISIGMTFEGRHCRSEGTAEYRLR